MENKKNGIWLGLIIGLLIGAIACLSIYIIVDKKDNDKKEDKKDTQETKKDDKNVDDKKDDVKNLSNQTFDLANFDESLVINKRDNVVYKTDGLKEIESYLRVGTPGTEINDLIKTNINSDNKSVDVSINWTGLSYDVDFDNSAYYDYKITNIDNNIRKVYIGGFGQSFGYETILYLMKDGTVEYTPITRDVVADAIKDSKNYSLKSYGKLNDVEDVVMIAQLGSCVSSGAGCWYTTIAIKADGTFYDLKPILEQTDYYK